MSNEKHYPLHPSHAEPMYMQISRDTFDSMSAELEELRKLVVPTDLLKAEIDSLKREIDMYKSITQGDKTTIDDVVEINTLTSDVKALREMNVKLQGEKIQLEDDVALLRKNNEELKEERRWRKFPDEKPHENESIVLVAFVSKIAPTIYTLREAVYSEGLEEFFNPMDHTESLDIEYWKPRPKAPEVD